MSPLSATVFLLAIGLISVIEATPIINSPTTLVQCQPAALTWSEAVPPVYISAVEGTSTASTPLISFAPQAEAAGTMTWDHVNVTSGTVLTFIINDAKGINNFSGQVTVKPGSSDCNPTIGDGATAAATTPASGASSNTGSSSSSGTGGATTSPSTTSSTSPQVASHPSTTSSPSTAHNTTTTGSSTGSSNSANTSSTKSTASTTSGAVDSSANMVIAGTFAAMAGVLVASGLF